MEGCFGQRARVPLGILFAAGPTDTRPESHIDTPWACRKVAHSTSSRWSWIDALRRPRYTIACLADVLDPGHALVRFVLIGGGEVRLQAVHRHFCSSHFCFNRPFTIWQREESCARPSPIFCRSLPMLIQIQIAIRAAQASSRLTFFFVAPRIVLGIRVFLLLSTISSRPLFLESL